MYVIHCEQKRIRFQIKFLISGPASKFIRGSKIVKSKLMDFLARRLNFYKSMCRSLLKTNLKQSHYLLSEGFISS